MIAPVLAVRGSAGRRRGPAPVAEPSTIRLPAPSVPHVPAHRRAGFTIQVPPRGDHVLVCGECSRAVGLESLEWFPGRRRVGCIACVNATRVSAQ